MNGKLQHFEMPAGDPARATKFYESVFGWKFTKAEPDFFQYWMADAVPTPATFKREGDQKGPIIYLTVDDIAASIKKVREAGGKADDKQPIPTQGWHSRCTDTEGNPFTLYQTDASVPLPSA